MGYFNVLGNHYGARSFETLANTCGSLGRTSSELAQVFVHAVQHDGPLPRRIETDATYRTVESSVSVGPNDPALPVTIGSTGSERDPQYLVNRILRTEKSCLIANIEEAKKYLGLAADTQAGSFYNYAKLLQLLEQVTGKTDVDSYTGYFAKRPDNSALLGAAGQLNDLSTSSQRSALLFETLVEELSGAKTKGIAILLPAAAAAVSSVYFLFG